MDPNELESLSVTLWLTELKHIQMALENVEETIAQILPIESVMRLIKKYEKGRERAKAILQSTQESLHKQGEMLEDIKRGLG